MGSVEKYIWMRGVYTGASFCFAISYEMRGKLYATAGFWGVWGKTVA